MSSDNLQAVCGHLDSALPGSVEAASRDARLSDCRHPDEDAGRDGGDGCDQPPADTTVHDQPFCVVDVPGSMSIATCRSVEAGGRNACLGGGGEPDEDAGRHGCDCYDQPPADATHVSRP